jgi:hypothetical protein
MWELQDKNWIRIRELQDNSWIEYLITLGTLGQELDTGYENYRTRA